MRSTDPTRRGLGLSLAALSLVGPRPGRAQPAVAPLPPPAGRPILTVSGRLTRPNAGATVVLDRATLEGLGQDGFETSSPWFTGPMRFDGVPMSRLMQAVGAEGTAVRATALNDYTTEIPMADFERFGVLLALRRNGEYMPVRDKGPLFIIYPFDRFPELQTRQYYSRSAWQVAALAIA